MGNEHDISMKSQFTLIHNLIINPTNFIPRRFTLAQPNTNHRRSSLSSTKYERIPLSIHKVHSVSKQRNTTTTEMNNMYFDLENKINNSKGFQFRNKSQSVFSNFSNLSDTSNYKRTLTTQYKINTNLNNLKSLKPILKNVSEKHKTINRQSSVNFDNISKYKDYFKDSTPNPNQFKKMNTYISKGKFNYQETCFLNNFEDASKHSK